MSDYRTGAIGLLGFYRYYRFIVIGLLGLCAFIVYVIHISDFRIYVVLYFGFMSLSIFRMLFYIMDFQHGCRV